MMYEVYYAKVIPAKYDPKPVFLFLNKRHVMTLARMKKIMKWYHKRCGNILDISYKCLRKKKKD